MDMLCVCTKCMLYRNVTNLNLKHTYKLLRLPWKIWKNIVKLRCYNHELEVETGQYVNIDRDLRYCGKCDVNVIIDRDHVFFECSSPNISLHKTRFIPVYFRKKLQHV